MVSSALIGLVKPRRALAAIATIAAMLAAAPAATAARAPIRSLVRSAALQALTQPREHTDASGGPFIKTKTIPASRFHGLNAVVRPFALNLLYCDLGCSIPIPHGEYQLAGFQLSPFLPGDHLTGGCVHCSGTGQFKPFTVHHHLLDERIRGRRYMDHNTKFIEGILRPDKIGRIKGYAVRTPPQRPKPLVTICTGADTTTNVFSLLVNGKPLPTVPCHQATPVDTAIGYVTQPERSATAPLVGAFAARFSGPRWVSVFDSPIDCRLNSQAMAHTSQATLLALYHVPGNREFSKPFSLSSGTTVGHVCMYVQIGGRYHGIPDGRVTAIGDHTYWAGDSAAVSGPSTATTDQQVAETVTGHASRREGLWLFVSASPCQAGAKKESRVAYGVFTTPVEGNFTQTVTSVPITSNSFFCAYLVTKPSPAGTKHPNSVTLASASAPITVTPPATAAQAQRLGHHAVAVPPGDRQMLPTAAPLSVRGPAFRTP